MNAARAQRLIFALVVSLLLVSQIAGIALGLGVASQFSTNSDFNGAATLDDMDVENNNVAYDNRSYGTSAPLLPDVPQTTGTTGDSGVVITPNQNLNGITVVLQQQSDASRVLLLNETSTVETATVTDGVATLSSTLDSGKHYYVVADDSGSSYSLNYGAATYPFTSSSLDVVAGANGRSNQSGTLYNIRAVYETGDTLASIANNDSQYVGGNHTIYDPAELAIDLTLENTSATVAVERYTGSSWVIANQSSFSSSGNQTVIVTDTGDKWRTNITVSASDVDSTAIIHDETYLYDGSSPQVSDIKPVDESYTDGTTTLSANVNDSDFATQQSDTVTVEFLINGSVVGTDTLSSNGSASTSWNPSIAGPRSYTVKATDDYGNSVTTTQRTLNVPSDLVIRNETNTSQIITDVNGTAEVTFFGSETIESRPIVNGSVDLSGLPADESFIAEVNVDGYTPRTVYITSLLDQQNVYLLNTNASSVDTRFVLEDPTGNYPPETFLILQKAINNSGNVTYETIYADRFGVEGVTATLQQGARYRVQIRGPDGNVQDIGPYRADVSETVTVRPGSPTITLGEYEEGWAANAELNNQTLEYQYDDPDGDTSKLVLWVHEKGNTSNQLATNRTYYDLGSVSGTYNLTANESKKTWVVNFIKTRNSNTTTNQVVVANRPDLVPDLSREWRLIVGVGVLLISAGIFSMLNAGVGAVVISLEGGVLWWSGWLEGATIGAAVVIALMVSIMAHMYSKS